MTVQRDPSAVPFSVFTVDSGVTVSLSGMTIAGGYAFEGGNGGGLDNFGALTVSNSVFSSNSVNNGDISSGSSGDGGGIANERGGTLTVSGSSFTGNSTGIGGQGGGIFNENARLRR